MREPQPNVFPAPTRGCATCRHIRAEFRWFHESYLDAWPVRYVCAIKASLDAPHQSNCRKYEREPGAD